MDSVGSKEDDVNTECFPMKLMNLIDDESNSDVIIWSPKGDGFVIMNKNRLTTEVLPKVFKLTQYTSFTRRLKRWGFVTTRGFSTTPSYHHPLFRRNDPSSIKKMRPLSRRHQYRRRNPQQVSQLQYASQPATQLPMFSMYNLSVSNPNLALEMAYFDRLRSMNYNSNGTSLHAVPSNMMMMNMTMPCSQNIISATQNSIPPSQHAMLSAQNLIPSSQSYTMPTVNLNHMEAYNQFPIASVYNQLGNARMLNQMPTLFQTAPKSMYANNHGIHSANGTSLPTMSLNSQHNLNINGGPSSQKDNYDTQSRNF